MMAFRLRVSIRVGISLLVLGLPIFPPGVKSQGEGAIGGLRT